MPRTQEQYEAMRTATRNKIHSAAIKLFAKKGFAAASVKDIAENAGISIGLMYRHYKTKGDLFNELISYAAEGLEAIVTRFQSDESPIELIRQFTLEILDDLNNDDEIAEFYMLMNQSLSMEEPSFQIQDLNKQSDAMLNQTIRLIEKGQKYNQFKQGNASEMAFYFLASIQGLMMIKLTMGERFETPSLKIVTGFLIRDGHD
ncbi:TetR family transcriptional regulator [Virgibacillus indicus]|uniref:TetR family transcriptional regulator n=1 Tax=Virgibacillus indicus TaxID=2024554 RepID=A0A265N6P1_9BACI|nr:TetR/AcrR family transcriptional regulator [Virgibacillus indicus]OZU87471.1 TetR family transcriptional regulator [Virgibacillus indicus]